jgi:site-specific DNA recombinase
LVPAALYLRYSTEMQRDGMSIETQERYGRDWAIRFGRSVVAVYIDEAESGGDHNRAGFQRLISDCKSAARIFAEVILYHTWRFSRAYDDSIIFTEIERAGVVVRSVTEGYDASTASGRFQRHMSLGVGAYMVEQLSDATRGGKQERARGSDRKGVSGRSNGRPPWGYTRINGVDVPDMRVAVSGDQPLTNWDGAQLFKQLALAGLHDNEIARDLSAAGFRTPATARHPARPFSKDTIASMLHNQFYVGRVSYRGMADLFVDRKANKRKPKAATQWFEASHEPLFTPDEWAAAQAIRATRKRHSGGQPQKRVYLLTGRRCSVCGETMRGKWVSDRGAIGYTCTAHERGIPCSAPRSVVRESALVGQIEALIMALAIDDEMRADAAAMHSEQTTTDAIQFQRDELQHERRAILLQHQKGYRSDADLDAEIERIDAALARLVMPTAPKVATAGRRLRELIDAWQVGDSEDRRDILAELLDHARIDVAAKRIAEFVPPAELAPWFDEAGLRRTARGYAIDAPVNGETLI